ncbi:MAG: NotI family restriction endonuclease [Rhodospirillales bacterium]|nr:NotI family restriction endonuclease [Rhodospirillales bacterium]
MSRYGIAEWFGRPLHTLAPSERQSLARAALKQEPAPPCPFQTGRPRCSKAGGVCSIRQGDGRPVILCPRRFDETSLIPHWLGEIVGFSDIYLAREIGFMRHPETGQSAGKIDIIIARDRDASAWFGLEIQAVYFSGDAMLPEFEALLVNDDPAPPPTVGRRRPDWRSSSAKRLMPQLQIKGPTLRQWLTKLAVAVDQPFFEAIGGPTASPSQDLNDGDIVWLVPRIGDDFRLERHHWEVLSLEASSEKLLYADRIGRPEFDAALRAKLKPLGEAR